MDQYYYGKNKITWVSVSEDDGSAEVYTLTPTTVGGYWRCVDQAGNRWTLHYSDFPQQTQAVPDTAAEDENWALLMQAVSADRHKDAARFVACPVCGHEYEPSFQEVDGAMVETTFCPACSAAAAAAGETLTAAEFAKMQEDKAKAYATAAKQWRERAKQDAGHAPAEKEKKDGTPRWKSLDDAVKAAGGFRFSRRRGFTAPEVVSKMLRALLAIRSR